MADVQIRGIFFRFQPPPDPFPGHVRCLIDTAEDHILNFFLQKIIQLIAFSIEKFDSVILKAVM